MKYVLLAILATFSLSVTAATTVKSSKSNSSERGKPTKEQIEQCAASKDAKFKQVCTQQGIAVTDEGVASAKQKAGK
jgi:hypothetical protein